MAYLHADLLHEGLEVIWSDPAHDPERLAFRALRQRVARGEPLTSEDTQHGE